MVAVGNQKLGDTLTPERPASHLEHRRPASLCTHLMTYRQLLTVNPKQLHGYRMRLVSQIESMLEFPLSLYIFYFAKGASHHPAALEALPQRLEPLHQCDSDAANARDGWAQKSDGVEVETGW